MIINKIQNKPRKNLAFLSLPMYSITGFGQKSSLNLEQDLLRFVLITTLAFTITFNRKRHLNIIRAEFRLGTIGLGPRNPTNWVSPRWRNLLGCFHILRTFCAYKYTFNIVFLISIIKKRTFKNDIRFREISRTIVNCIIFLPLLLFLAHRTARRLHVILLCVCCTIEINCLWRFCRVGCHRAQGVCVCVETYYIVITRRYPYRRTNRLNEGGILLRVIIKDNIYACRPVSVFFFFFENKSLDVSIPNVSTLHYSQKALRKTRWISRRLCPSFTRFFCLFLVRVPSRVSRFPSVCIFSKLFRNVHKFQIINEILFAAPSLFV